MVVNCYYESWHFGRKKLDFHPKPDQFNLICLNLFYSSHYHSTHVRNLRYVGIIIRLCIYLDYDYDCFRSLQCYRQGFVGQTIDQWRCCFAYCIHLGSRTCMDTRTILWMEQIRSRRQHDCLRYWLPYQGLDEPFLHLGLQFLRLHYSIVVDHLLILLHCTGNYRDYSLNLLQIEWWYQLY